MAVSRTRAEILIGKALREASLAAVSSYELLGVPTIPEPHGMAVARAMARAWTQSIKRESIAVQDGVGEVKATRIWEFLAATYARLFGGRAVQDVLDTTRKQVAEKMEQALVEGQGVAEAASNLRKAIPQMTRLRAATIARTETHSAAQFASLETAKRYPFKVEKTWNSTADHRTRDFGEGDGKVDQANHRAMNGVTVPLDEPFMVPNKWGGFDPMMFPGDQNAPAYNVVNCRCSLTYRRVGRVIAP